MRRSVRASRQQSGPDRSTQRNIGRGKKPTIVAILRNIAPNATEVAFQNWLLLH